MCTSALNFSFKATAAGRVGGTKYRNAPITTKVDICIDHVANAAHLILEFFPAERCREILEDSAVLCGPAHKQGLKHWLAMFGGQRRPAGKTEVSLTHPSGAPPPPSPPPPLGGPLVMFCGAAFRPLFLAISHLMRCEPMRTSFSPTTASSASRASSYTCQRG